MGQAAVDLPESDSQTPAPPGSADDLLSQLAGQEIDRLLAESEASAPPRGDIPPAAPDLDESPEALEKLLEPAKLEAEIKAPAAPASPAATGNDAFQAEIDNLFKELKADDPAKSVPAPAAEVAPAPLQTEAAAAKIDDLSKEQNAGDVKPAPAPIAQAPQTKVEVAPPPAPAPVEQPTSAAERAALTPAPEPEPQLERVLNQMPATRTSFVVRVLEILNSPFQSCPDTVRDTLGKVAILTLMNSLGVLMYLMLFRK